MDKSFWNQILALLSQSTDQSRFETWFKPLIPIEYTDKDILILGVQNEFISDFLDNNYKKIILSCSKKIIPSISSVKFIIKKTENKKGVPPKTPVSDNYLVKTSASKSNIDNNVNDQYNFDSFITGSGNEFAKSVSLAVAENPGKTKFNPLLIYSGVGLGKTHLLHAICNFINSNNSNLSYNLVSSEEFYYDFIEAIKNSNTKSFAEKFQKSDILLVDDIQFMSGKERTQEEFFYIFNTLYQQHKQIVLTSDQPPNLIKGLHDRLVSRFQWGLCVDIQPPDLETRVAILKKKAERDNLNISEDILYYIAENITSNIRKLEGIIIRILAFASLTKSDVTLDLVKNILSDSVKKEQSKLSVDDIIHTVSKYYKIPVDNIREKNRSKEVAHCRQVAMFISKTYTNYSLKTIGLNFGGRDHSTVIHAVKQIKDNIEKDKTLSNDINYILSQLKN
jgi:chromosomal replication initiator protein